MISPDNIQLLAFDMDNTLLLPNKTLSPLTTITLRKLRDQGKKIVLTTGRPYPNVSQFIDQIELHAPDDYAVLFNGALIENMFTHDVLLNETFTKSDLYSILPILQRLNLSIDLVNREKVYAISDLKISKYNTLISGLIPYEVSSLAHIPDTLTFNKFVVYAKDEELQALEQSLGQKFNNEFNFIRSRRILLEFIKPNINKANALNQLLINFNLTPNQLMAFGDEENDKEMIEFAGMGVAMKNAIPSVKAVANDVTAKDNANEGVAHYLRNYFNL